MVPPCNYSPSVQLLSPPEDTEPHSPVKALCESVSGVSRPDGDSFSIACLDQTHADLIDFWRGSVQGEKAPQRMRTFI